MNELTTELGQKLATLIDTRQFDIDSLDSQIKKLQGKKKELSIDIDDFKDQLRDAMWSNGISKIEHEAFEFSCSKPSEVVKVTDESALDDLYFRVKKEVDKSGLKTDLKRGEIIKGAELTQGKPRLTIKIKEAK